MLKMAAATSTSTSPTPSDSTSVSDSAKSLLTGIWGPRGLRFKMVILDSITY